MDGTLATLGPLVLGVMLAGAGTNPAGAGQVAGPSPVPRTRGAPLERVLVAVPDTDPLSAGVSHTALMTRLHVADPRATAVVLLPGDPSRTIGSFEISLAPPADADDALTELRIRIEFLQPASDRLTDEAWHSMLDAGEVPPRPDWIGPTMR